MLHVMFALHACLVSLENGWQPYNFIRHHSMAPAPLPRCGGQRVSDTYVVHFTFYPSLYTPTQNSPPNSIKVLKLDSAPYHLLNQFVSQP